MFDSLKVRARVLVALVFLLLVTAFSITAGARHALADALDPRFTVATMQQAIEADDEPNLVATSPPSDDAVIQHATDAATHTSDPGVLAVLGLLVAVAFWRKIFAARIPFFASGAGAALLTLVFGFLGALADAAASGGAVTGATLAYAFATIGGAAAIYGIARPLLFPLLIKAGNSFAEDSWPQRATQLLLVLPTWILKKPGANGIGTSPSSPGIILPGEQLKNVRGGGIGTSPSYNGDDVPTIPGGGF